MNRKEEERVGRLNGRINRRNAVLFDESYENDLVESIGESSLGKLM
jgi:hypothetical protein